MEYDEQRNLAETFRRELPTVYTQEEGEAAVCDILKKEGIPFKTVSLDRTADGLVRIVITGERNQHRTIAFN